MQRRVCLHWEMQMANISDALSLILQKQSESKCRGCQGRAELVLVYQTLMYCCMQPSGLSCPVSHPRPQVTLTMAIRESVMPRAILQNEGDIGTLGCGAFQALTYADSVGGGEVLNAG